MREDHRRIDHAATGKIAQDMRYYFGVFFFPEPGSERLVFDKVVESLLSHHSGSDQGPFQSLVNHIDTYRKYPNTAFLAEATAAENLGCVFPTLAGLIYPEYNQKILDRMQRVCDFYLGIAEAGFKRAQEKNGDVDEGTYIAQFFQHRARYIASKYRLTDKNIKHNTLLQS